MDIKKNEFRKVTSMKQDIKLMMGLYFRLDYGYIISCAKHFPGHESTVGDPHEEIVRADRTLQELENRDLIPFKSIIEEKIPMIWPGISSILK